jgi:DnaD/phage-associated family protein
MTRFGGFPTKTKFTPIPNVFFTRLLPEIDDPAELKVTLHIIWAIYQKRGYPRFMTYRELLSSPELMKGLVNNGSRSQLLKRALTQAVDRGTLLHVTLERDGEVEDLYLVNTDDGRRAVERIGSGEIKLGGLVAAEPEPEGAERPNIFELYEQNIGMLSPIIVEQLKEAERSYPEPWIEDAFRIAVDLNKRNWRYISRILERWDVEGKDDGEHRRHSEAESDPEEYYRRYGHLLRK